MVVAALAAALHVAIWRMESLVWRAPATWRRFSVASQDDADTLAPMAYNQGFYNLFLAVEVALGIGLLVTGNQGAGRALVLFGCGSMVAAALVLRTGDRHYTRAAVTQGTLPLLAIALLLLSTR
jgi:putative membrane protein